MFFFDKIILYKVEFCGGSMVQDYKLYKTLLEAIKISINNSNLESDMENLKIDNLVKQNLLNDKDIKKMLIRR